MRFVFKFALLLLFIFNTINLFGQNEDIQGTVVERLLYEIDDSYRENMTLSASRNGFHEIIYKLATSGYKGKTIPAYKDSSLMITKSPAEILELGKNTETIEYAPDPDYPNYMVDTMIIDPFSPTSISRYLILFDSIALNDGSSAYNPRAIAPLYSSNIYGVDVKESILFWVNWTDLVPVLKNIPFYSGYNRNGQLSYFDFFTKHLFVTSAINENIIIE